MPKSPDEKSHDHRLTLFAVSAGMVGVCLTGVGLIGIVKGIRNIESTVDEILSLSALLFLMSTAFYFFALYRGDQANRKWVDILADAIFFLSLTLLLVACIVFTFGFK
jgi:hypothetical protein